MLCLLCTTILLIGGCSSQGSENKKKKTVVTTIFPLYDWARNIMGDSDDVELILLMSSGSDLHNYQPSVNDIIKVTDCDLFVYIGGESDEWAEDIIEEREKAGKKNLDLIDELSEFIREEELAEGMQGEAEEGEYDEHIWLSLRIAQKACDLIRRDLSEIDKSNGSKYQQNCSEYVEMLGKLDESYVATVNESYGNVLLFADRFPFRYLVEDYGLTYYAAFKGCSAESEASFETIRFLAEKADENGLEYILILENNNGKIARTIIESTIKKDQEILTIDSMQSVTGSDAANGASYLHIMQKNLEVLGKALGRHDFGHK